MLIVEEFIPIPTGTRCTDERGNGRKPKCGLLQLNGSEVVCHQEDCNEHHPAFCVKNIKHAS